MIVQKKLKHKFKNQILFFSILTISTSLFGAQGPSGHPKYNDLKALLPQDDNTILTIKDLPGGKNNSISVCQTSHKKYLLRQPQKKVPDDSFRQIINVHKQIAALEIGPRVYNFTFDTQKILMDHIENKPWLPYEFYPAPYHETMKALKKFHDTIAQPGCFQSKYASDYWPFHFIRASMLTSNAHAPALFMQASAIVQAFSERLAPLFSARKLVCHGDFHKNNVLLDSNGKPIIIDLDNIEYGHPFYDVAKFTWGFNPKQRTALLKTYLGEREPIQEEAEHFSIISNVALMVDSTIKLEDLSDSHQLQDQSTGQAKADFACAMGNIKIFLDNTKKSIQA